MGIYFRDILLISISRGANNCGQHALEKNIYFIMRFSPHFQLFYFSDRLEFCEFFEWKIKRINNADLFSQTPFLTFIKGANISGGHCTWLKSNAFRRVIPVYWHAGDSSAKELHKKIHSLQQMFLQSLEISLRCCTTRRATVKLNESQKMAAYRHWFPPCLSVGSSGVLWLSLN